MIMDNELKKCIIRSWSENDICSLAKYLNNKKIWDNCRDSLPFPYSENDAGQFIQFVSGQDEQSNYCIEINREAFRKCGIHHKSCFKNGQFIDCHYYELLKENFKN